MLDDLNKMADEVGKQRQVIINKLVQFSLTDMLLFWGQNKDLILLQEQEWAPLLQWAGQKLNVKLKTTQSLDVPKENEEAGWRLRKILEGFSDKELVAFYAAALNMRSVLLAFALVKGKINAEEAFHAAFLEEIWQAENWGVEEEAEKRRQSLKKELQEIEKFLRG